jgi:hypothetical protein
MVTVDGGAPQAATVVTGSTWSLPLALAGRARGVHHRRHRDPDPAHRQRRRLPLVVDLTAALARRPASTAIGRHPAVDPPRLHRTRLAPRATA